MDMNFGDIFVVLYDGQSYLCEPCAVEEKIELESQSVCTWAVGSDGWLNPIMCKKCKRSIPVICDGEPAKTKKDMSDNDKLLHLRPKLSTQLRELAKRAQSDKETEAKRHERYLAEWMGDRVDEAAGKMFDHLEEELRKKVQSSIRAGSWITLEAVTSGAPAEIQREFHNAVVKIVIDRFKHEGFEVASMYPECWDEKSVFDYGENAAPNGCSCPINVKF